MFWGWMSCYLPPYCLLFSTRNICVCVLFRARDFRTTIFVGFGWALEVEDVCLPCVVFLLLWRARLSLPSPSSQPAEWEARQREQLFTPVLWKYTLRALLANEFASVQTGTLMKAYCVVSARDLFIFSPTHLSVTWQCLIAAKCWYRKCLMLH